MIQLSFSPWIVVMLSRGPGFDSRAQPKLNTSSMELGLFCLLLESLVSEWRVPRALCESSSLWFCLCAGSLLVHVSVFVSVLPFTYMTCCLEVIWSISVLVDHIWLLRPIYPDLTLDIVKSSLNKSNLS